ncbi:MAG TPA: NADP-dependent oxidoreductase [Tepidisphaeraceae bacterium]|jgi:NADPH:quinone reductase-like Zn-dependent oxidoreductase|nr:NADP-dependent oxidoreductase [Tepidisphaeraceae bacterium]
MATATLESETRTPTIPATMKAAAIDRFGPPDVLTLHTLPTPRPGPGEVLIAVHGAGVGVWDAEIRGGWWPQGKPKFPVVLGTDGAGVIVAKGTGVRRFSVGDRVWASEFINPKGGFYAQFVAVSAEHAGLVPERLDLLHAGAAAVTGLTALQGIDDHLGVRARETVLILGASGAVGTLAVQFAKRKGATVIGTVRGRDAARLVKELGADATIDDSKDDNYAEPLRTLAPRGLDAVLALAGGDALNACLDQIKPGGRIAYPNGVEPAPRKRPGMNLISYDAEAGPRQWARLSRATDEAKLEVPLAATLPLARAAQAHERVEKGHMLGRVVLRVRSGNG